MKEESKENVSVSLPPLQPCSHFPLVKVYPRANSPLFLLYNPTPWQLLRMQIPCPRSERMASCERGTNRETKGQLGETEKVDKICFNTLLDVILSGK